jgi:hypothetical protein
MSERGEGGLREFITLQPGEWDMRSSGGAYIRGDRFGRLTLSGGAVTSFALDKNRNELTGRQDLFILGGDGVEMRLGTTKRLLPPAFSEAVATYAHGAVVPGIAPSGTNKELRIRVGKDLALGARQDLYEARAGHLVNDTGTAPVLQSSTNLPLRYRARFWNDVPTVPQETLSVEVDNLGNVRVSQSALAVAGGMDVTLGASSPLTVSANRITVTATSAATIAGATVNLNAGGTADQAMVRGDALNTFLTTRLSVLTAFGPSGPAIVPLAAGVELSVAARVR